MKALRRQDADAVIRGFGGDDMKEAGMDLAVHYNQLAFMGFITLLANYVYMRFLTNHWIHQSGGMPFFVVALLINRSFEMFASLLGTWIPFALIFLSTYLTGLLTTNDTRLPER